MYDVTPYMRAIKTASPGLDSRSGLSLTLECGHLVLSYGTLTNLDPFGGKVLCTQCMEERKEEVHA